METEHDSPVRRTDIISFAHPAYADELSDGDADILDAFASQTEAQQIIVYDVDPLHFGYFDKSERDVNHGALLMAVKKGLLIIHAGTKKCNAVDEKRAWFEAKPRSFYEENDWL